MNLLWRALEGIPDGVDADPYAYVTQVFKNIAMADVATSAVMAQQKGYFRKTDGVSFDKARLLWEAKQRAIGLARSGYQPPSPTRGRHLHLHEPAGCAARCGTHPRDPARRRR